MNSARFLVAVLILVGAALAACSGNFGSGTTPPNGLLPSGNLAGISPTPTPTPNSASNIVTYGSSTAFQPLPQAAGYGGAIAFPIPSPKPSGFTDIAVGATISVVRPSDVPDLNLTGGKGKKGGGKRERPARQLVYITLLPTHDMTLESYPRIAIDVPRDIVAVYRENDFGIAMYNAGAKDTAFRLAVAELDTATPPPTPSPNPSAPPPPSAIPVSATAAPSGVRASASPTPLPSGVTPSPVASGVGSAAPSASPSLPPQRITFAGTAATLKLTANRAVTFALYALPVSTPSPNPHASATTAAGKPVPAGSGTPAPAGSGTPAPAGSSVPTASGSPIATGSPAAAGTATPGPAKT
jgi:hypothetical protein